MVHFSNNEMVRWESDGRNYQTAFSMTAKNIKGSMVSLALLQTFLIPENY
jgi:hypothetical protein